MSHIDQLASFTLLSFVIISSREENKAKGRMSYFSAEINMIYHLPSKYPIFKNLYFTSKAKEDIDEADTVA